jgi:uncharacterized protein YqgC (DUF456 family)
MDWVYYTALIALLLTGLFLNLLGLPGLWLMVAAAVGYAWATRWDYLGWPGLLALLILAILAEVVEFLAGSAGAKKAGGSIRGMIGAIIGGLLGGFFLTFLVPVPILGTIVGVCVGTFLGAWGVELLVGKQMNESVQIGIGAAKGRLWGTLLKSLFGVAMLVVAMLTALPIGGAGPATLPPVTTQPTTVPTDPTTAPATAPATLPPVER